MRIDEVTFYQYARIFVRTYANYACISHYLISIVYIILYAYNRSYPLSICKNIRMYVCELCVRTVFYMYTNACRKYYEMQKLRQENVFSSKNSFTVKNRSPYAHAHTHTITHTHTQAHTHTHTNTHVTNTNVRIL